MSAIVFNEVIGDKQYGETKSPVSLQIEQQDESGFTWQILDETFAEPIAEGYTRYQPMALVVGKIAAKLWIDNDTTPFDPAVADDNQQSELSLCAFGLVEAVTEVCEEKGLTAPFWLDFVSDLDSKLDELMVIEDEITEAEIEPDYDDDSDGQEIDGVWYPNEGESGPDDKDRPDDSDFTQEDAINNYIGDRD